MYLCMYVWYWVHVARSTIQIYFQTCPFACLCLFVIIDPISQQQVVLCQANTFHSTLTKLQSLCDTQNPHLQHTHTHTHACYHPSGPAIVSHCFSAPPRPPTPPPPPPQLPTPFKLILASSDLFLLEKRALPLLFF